jgi:hypothetical protein
LKRERERERAGWLFAVLLGMRGGCESGELSTTNWTREKDLAVAT